VSTPIEGGRALLRGRVFGFPVHLDLSFVIIMAVLGYYPGISAGDMGLWLLITPFAVLVHELGHAITARAAGADPHIALAGFGGVTTFTPPGPLSRARSLGISLAGPAVGLALGAVLLVIQTAVGDTLDPFAWQSTALWIGIWTCIGWSVLNLLPVLPLDGGQAMRELLPGSPEVRSRRAAAVSVVAAVAAALLAYLVLDQLYLALFMAFFAVSNVLALRQPSESPAGGIGHAGTPEQSVVGLLWQGEPAKARQLLASLPPESVDVAVHGAVLALTGDRGQGYALLAQEAERRPGDPNVAALLVLARTLDHDWDGVLGTLEGRGGSSVPRPVIHRAIEEAQATGRADVAGRLTVLADGWRSDQPDPPSP
jgi:Zn-dependent protease